MVGKVAVEAAGALRGVVTGPFVTPSPPLLFGETAWEAVGPTAGLLTAPEGDVLSSAALTRKSNPPLSMLFAPLLVGIRHNVGMHATGQGLHGLEFCGATLTGNSKKFTTLTPTLTLGRCRLERTKKLALNRKSGKEETFPLFPLPFLPRSVDV